MYDPFDIDGDGQHNMLEESLMGAASIAPYEDEYGFSNFEEETEEQKAPRKGPAPRPQKPNPIGCGGAPMCLCAAAALAGILWAVLG